MKRHWDIEELIEQFTLLPKELELLANKTGPTRLGFALLLTYFQAEGRFPTGRHEIPNVVADYVAKQLGMSTDLILDYDWTGRSSTSHRSQIRAHCAFREAAGADLEEMSAWLVAEQLSTDQHPDHLRAAVVARFRARKVEPPTSERMEQLIRSACAHYDQQLCAETARQLPAATRERFDRLLAHSLTAAESPAGASDQSVPAEAMTLHDLKTSPGPVGLESILQELAKVRMLSQFALPPDLFAGVSAKVLTVYRERAATETLHELRRHPEATRYTLPKLRPECSCGSPGR